MANAVKAAAITALTVLFFVLLLVNILGGVVSGVWLLVKGQWGLVVSGIAMSFAMPWAWSIASLPAFAVAALLFADTEKRGRATLASGALFMTFWNAAVMAGW